jgi:hypothetical protein
MHKNNFVKTKALLSSAGILLLSVNSAYAADTSDIDSGHRVKIRGKEVFALDTNPLRSVNNSDTIIGSETTLGVILGDVTPTHRVYLDSTINYNRYDDSDFNTTNFHEALGLYKMNQRWLAGVEGRFDYDTTRTSEITSFGVAIPKVRSTSYALSPQISFQQNIVDKWSLNSNLAKVKYDSNAFVDYTSLSINPAYYHNFDPNNAGIFMFNYQRYDADNFENSKTDSIGPSLGWTRVINDRLSTKITAGVERSTKSSDLADDTSRMNYVFSASANFKGEQDIASISATRAQQQFANGSSALLTSFDATEEHALNDKLKLNAAANYSFTNYQDPTSVNLDRQYKASAGATYNLLNNLDVTSKYMYIHQKLIGISDPVKEHIVLIGLEYHPDFSPL